MTHADDFAWADLQATIATIHHPLQATAAITRPAASSVHHTRPHLIDQGGDMGLDAARAILLRGVVLDDDSDDFTTPTPSPTKPGA